MPTSKATEFFKKDLYGILGVASDASEKEIIKAYKKKALRYHPDKNPDDPKAAELFQEIYEICEILKDVAARAAYDKLRQAKEKAAERTRALDSKRKKFKEDLEAREQKFNDQLKKEEEKEAEGRLRKEVERLREEGNRLLEQEQERLREELRQSDADKSSLNEESDDGPPRLKLKWFAKKGDPDNGGYNKANLTSILSCYGNLSAVVISSKRNGSAIAEFGGGGLDPAILEESGLSDNPFSITWLVGKPQQSQTFASQSGSAGQPLNIEESVRGGLFTGGLHGFDDRPVQFMSGASTIPSSTGIGSADVESRDFENLVLRRMRQAEERKKLIQQMEQQDQADT